MKDKPKILIAGLPKSPNSSSTIVRKVSTKKDSSQWLLLPTSLVIYHRRITLWCYLALKTNDVIVLWLTKVPDEIKRGTDREHDYNRGQKKYAHDNDETSITNASYRYSVKRRRDQFHHTPSRHLEIGHRVIESLKRLNYWPTKSDKAKDKIKRIHKLVFV